MFYILFNVILFAWVIYDAWHRRTYAWAWGIGTLLLGPLIVPIYLGVRPLRKDELREGGKMWNVMRNFAILWTIFMVYIGIWSLFNLSKIVSTSQSDAEIAGSALGMGLGLTALGFIWFMPFIATIILGVIFKSDKKTEIGPTQELSLSPIPSFSTRNIIGVVIVGLFAAFLLYSSNHSSKLSGISNSEVPTTENAANHLENAADYLIIVDEKWSGDDIRTEWTITVKNYSDKDIKDVQFYTRYIFESGQIVDWSTETVFEIFPARQIKTVKFTDTFSYEGHPDGVQIEKAQWIDEEGKVK